MMERKDTILLAYVADDESKREYLPSFLTGSPTTSFENARSPRSFSSIDLIHESRRESALLFADCNKDHLTHFGKAFLSNRESSKVEDMPIENIETFSSHPMFDFCFFSDEEIDQMFKLLAMHDVAIERKTIISSSVQQTIVNTLNELEKNYLSICEKKKNLIKLPSLNLNSATFTKNQLNSILSARGCRRFFLSLYDIPSSLSWYIHNHIDKKFDASLIKKAPQINDAISHALYSHLTEVIEYIKNKE